MIIDLWYNDKLTDCDDITVTFYPNEGIYRGNILKSGRYIGDFTTDSSIEIEKTFGFLLGA